MFRNFKYNPIDDARFALLEGTAEALTDDEKRAVDIASFIGSFNNSSCAHAVADIDDFNFITVLECCLDVGENRCGRFHAEAHGSIIEWQLFRAFWCLYEEGIHAGICKAVLYNMADLDKLKEEIAGSYLFANVTGMGMKPLEGMTYIPDKSF